jgi:hypothetical protein
MSEAATCRRIPTDTEDRNPGISSYTRCAGCMSNPFGRARLQMLGQTLEEEIEARRCAPNCVLRCAACAPNRGSRWRVFRRLRCWRRRRVGSSTTRLTTPAAAYCCQHFTPQASPRFADFLAEAKRRSAAGSSLRSGPVASWKPMTSIFRVAGI